MRTICTLLFSVICITASAQPGRTKVMTLGTFHFNFPNLDVKQISGEDQIDVLDPQYQSEIRNIVGKIATFKPTIIVIERKPSEQRHTDSVYKHYVNDNYQLHRSEDEQLGFRLARLMGLSTLYCVDEWGNFNERINGIVFGSDSIEAKKFEDFFEQNPDSSKRFVLKPVFKQKGILAALRQANDEENIKKDLGNYLVGLFKYESKENDFTGVDFETGRWFSRNLKIFRNIQRIKAGPDDRILVIFGSGHMNVLNYLFDCSPEYDRVHTNDYLK